MNAVDTPRRRSAWETAWAYRRRLAAAAAASLLLHLLVARGLSLARLGLEGNAPGATATTKLLAPKRRSDYRLEVPKSAAQERPAHERPLDVRPVPPRDAPRPAPQPPRAEPAVAARPRQDPAVQLTPITPARPRNQPAPPMSASAAAPARAAGAPGTAVDLSAVGAAEAAAPAGPAPGPAAVARDRAAAAAVSAPQQPREVALLGRLAAVRPPARSQAGEVALGTGVAAPARSAAVIDAAATSPVAPADATATAASAAPISIRPRDLAAAPRTADAAVARGMSGGPGATGGGDPAGAPLAAFAPRAFTRGRESESALAAAGTGAAPARAAALDAAPVVGPVAPPPGDAAAVGGGGAGAGAAAAGLAVAPAAVGRAAATDASVAASIRDGLPDAAPADEDDGLSIATLAATGSGRPAARRDDGAPAALAAVPLERIAAAALPAEGRVRDVSEAFARRAPDKRAERRAGTPDAEAQATAERADALVARGLDFLARSQQPDGRWSLGRYAGSTPTDLPKLESDTAATGLALLSFLGAGHDHFDGPHRDTVRRGLEFLLAVQKPDGDLYLPADDLSNSCAWLYSHGIASMALCEAVGMTGDPLVKPAAARACGFIAASQHPERGGWRYTPASDTDLSVSGWMLVALRAGHLAGVPTDPRALDGVRRLLDASESADDPTRYAYNFRNPKQRPSRLSGACMTAVGSLMRLHTGWQPSDPRVVASGRSLAALPASYGSATDKIRDCYLWYYASQVLVHTGGREWDAWYRGLVDTLATAQDRDGATRGSWDPLGPTPDRWGPYGGRIYVTTLHLLALEVPYRHLPTYTAAR